MDCEYNRDLLFGPALVFRLVNGKLVGIHQGSFDEFMLQKSLIT